LTLLLRCPAAASLLETSDHGPYKCVFHTHSSCFRMSASLDTALVVVWRSRSSWDRLPFLTNVKFGNGTGSVSLAYNKLVSNFFFTGSPYSIDTGAHTYSIDTACLRR
jgi:hypothetical protein